MIGTQPTRKAESPHYEGWLYIISSGCLHYFRYGVSLCGKWSTRRVNGFSQGNDASPWHCPICKKNRLKEIGKD